MALMLERRDHAPVSLDTVYRDVDVFWSPDSQQVAFTNYRGSNVAALPPFERTYDRTYRHTPEPDVHKLLHL